MHAFKTRLQSATAYFNLPQSVAEAQDTNGDRMESAMLASHSENQDFHNDHGANSKIRQKHESLGLTGNIISATAHIPYVVGITKDGRFEIGPRPAKSVLRDTLSHLSLSPDWNHTLVGWTGKVLPVRGAEFGETLSQNDPVSPSAGHGGQLSDVAIHDLGGSGFNDAFLQHLKDKSSTEQEISVSKERRRELETLLEHAFKDKIVPVWLGDWHNEKRDILDLNNQDRWHAYAETQLLSTLNNVVVDRSHSTSQAFSDYQRMNESVADAIIKVYKPGDIIWVHDYHLMLLPAILRRRLPSAYITYFHYTHWAYERTFVQLDDHLAIAEGVLGATVIGTSTSTIRRKMEDYYRSALKLRVTEDSVIQKNRRSIQILDVPLGVDVKGVHDLAFSQANVDNFLQAISTKYANKQSIVVRARYHRSGILATLLDGFEHYLKQNVKQADHLVLFLVTAPGTQRDVSSTAASVIDDSTARRIVDLNSRYGSLLHQPIVQIHRTLGKDEYFALLRSADLGVVASDHGAANSMSMEFVICQQEKRSPLLIFEEAYPLMNQVSEYSSATSQANDIASRLQAALSMDTQEKAHEHKRLMKYFTSNDVGRFNTRFITEACTAFNNFAPYKDVPTLNATALSAKYSSAPRRLIMSDYDGTLTPIVNNPDAALPTEKLLEALQTLAAEGKNKVWIISGRSRVFLEKLFGDIKGLGLSAEHGSFIRRPGELDWNNLAASMDMGWKQETSKVFEGLVAQVEGSWIERKEVAIVWHYRNAADHDACLAKAIESKAQLEGDKLKNWDVEVMLGKANVEVRPRFLNKGVTAAGLIQEMFDDETSGFVLCAGDDVTDEDMFRALLSSKLDKDGVFSCLVSKSGKPSLAYYRTPEPTDLVNALSVLSAM